MPECKLKDWINKNKIHLAGKTAPIHIMVFNFTWCSTLERRKDFNVYLELLAKCRVTVIPKIVKLRVKPTGNYSRRTPKRITSSCLKTSAEQSSGQQIRISRKKTATIYRSLARCQLPSPVLPTTCPERQGYRENVHTGEERLGYKKHPTEKGINDPQPYIKRKEITHLYFVIHKAQTKVTIQQRIR